MQAFAEPRLTWVVTTLTALGCLTGGGPSVSYSLLEEIPLGIIDVTVTGWEEVPDIHSPLSSLSTPSGEKAVAVFVRWNGLHDYAEWDRQIFAKSFLSARLRLHDSDDFEVKAITAMTKEVYNFSSYMASAPRDFVVIFHVWVDSEGYTLYLEHPDPLEEEFHVAMVSLE